MSLPSHGYHEQIAHLSNKALAKQLKKVYALWNGIIDIAKRTQNLKKVVGYYNMNG
jgi:hypothetical protein